MKVLFGMIPPDAGEHRVSRPAARRPPSRASAMAAGIAMIHQHFMLVEAMTRGGERHARLAGGGRRADAVRRWRRASARQAGASGWTSIPTRVVADLPLGRRQRVEILKAILREAELLDPRRADLQSRSQRSRRPADNSSPAARGGQGHRLHHATSCPRCWKSATKWWCCARAAWPAARRSAGVSRAAARRNDGRARHNRAAHARSAPAGRRAAGCRRVSPGRGSAPLTFDVRGGEILGVAGVDGNGQIELAETLAGLRPRARRHRRARRARHHAGAASRLGYGRGSPICQPIAAIPRWCGAMSITENLMLRDSDRPPYARGAFLTRVRGREQGARP